MADRSLIPEARHLGQHRNGWEGVSLDDVFAPRREQRSSAEDRGVVDSRVPGVPTNSHGWEGVALTDVFASRAPQRAEGRQGGEQALTADPWEEREKKKKSLLEIIVARYGCLN